MSHGARGSGCHTIEINRTAMAIALTQTKNEMFFINYSRRSDRLDLARKEKRLGISVSKRLQHLVPPQKIHIDLRERQLVVQSHARLQSFVGKKFTRDFAKSFGKEAEILLASARPAAISCPPNLSRPSAQRLNASTRFNPSMLRPLPFPVRSRRSR